MPVVFVVDRVAAGGRRNDHAVLHIFRGRRCRQILTRSEHTRCPGSPDKAYPRWAQQTPAASRITSSRSPRTGRSSARVALFLLGMGAALWMNAVPAGPWLVAAGFARAARDAVRLVRHGDRRIRGAPVQQAGGRVVPLEHELVHLLRGDVLRRVLRRAVLHPRALGARPGRPDVEARLARLHGELADRTGRTSTSSSRRWGRSGSRCSTRSSS